ncbi:unnamed protein product [Cochlearia groenlandica]
MTHDDNSCPLRVVKPGQDRVNRRTDWDRRDGPKDRRNRRFGEERQNNPANRYNGNNSQVQEEQRVETQRDPPYQRKLQRQLLPEFMAADAAEKSAAENRETRDWVESSFRATERKVSAPGERELRLMTEKARTTANTATRAAVEAGPLQSLVSTTEKEPRQGQPAGTLRSIADQDRAAPVRGSRGQLRLKRRRC